MRMRRMKNLAPRMAAVDAYRVPDAKAMKGTWRSLMPQAKELRVEVGCGKGKFTVETAQQNPEILFIAIERVQEAMVIGMESAQKMGLKNVWFVDMDVAGITDCFEDSEVDLLYINFCDPWPRSKNAKRRLTYRAFLELYRVLLKDGGEIHFKTDNAGLFPFSLDEFRLCNMALREVTDDLHANGPVGVMTGYEEKFYNLGTPIHRCVAVSTKAGKPSDEVLYPKKKKAEEDAQ